MIIGTLMRMAGVAIICAGIIAAGIFYAASLSRRCASLGGFISALPVMRAEVACRREVFDIAEGLAASAGGGTAGFFARLSDRDRPFSVQWTEALELQRDRLRLRRCDLLLLGELGDCLGRYDEESQRMLLASIESRLSTLLAAAEEERTRKSRAAVTLAVTAAAMAAALLL